MLWSEVVGTALGIEAWDGDEAALLLDMARDVAHGTERRYAPLTAYAIGLAVGAAAAGAPPGGDESLVSRSNREPFLTNQVQAILAALERYTEQNES